MTTTTRHDDPTIDAFLADGDYASIEEWMEDSGYVRACILTEADILAGRDDDCSNHEHDEWCYPDDYADPTVAGMPVDPEGTIEGAIEACGFEA